MAAVLRWILLLGLMLSFNAMAGCRAAATPRNNLCDLEVISSSLTHWISPFFGVNDYPNSVSCSLQKTSNQPFWSWITFNSFDLEMPSDSGHCYDYVTFTTPHDFANPLHCGHQTGRIIELPSYNFDAFFFSDYIIPAAGYNISISRETSNCHELIEPPFIIGRSGIIKPPRKDNNIWEKKACEWWIRSPPGTKIQLEFLQMKLNSDCKESSVIVNTAGNNQYPVGSSGRHCGEEEPEPVVSNDNEIDVLFFAKNAKDFFRAKWTVVEA